MRELIATGRIAALAALLAIAGFCHAAVAEDTKIEAFSVWQGKGQTYVTGLKQGTRVRHPKYGEGTVFRREGDGDDAKITVQFQQHGVKKLVEKFAQLEAL